MINLKFPYFWKRKTLIVYLLWPLSLIYQLINILRHKLIKPIKLPAKVICVGNMTVGGTGKTQVVIWLSDLFKKRGLKFVILTKAYGGNLKGAVQVLRSHKPEEVGDESIMLLAHGDVIAFKDINKAYTLIKNLNVDLIISDDGMQSPYFYKDFTIITIDLSRPIDNEFLIPAGPYRQTKNSAFSEAQAVIAIGSKCQFDTDNLPIFYAQTVPIDNIDTNIKYIAFCGIGNPDKFFNMLKKHGANLLESIAYSDHHKYSEDDHSYLKKMAKTQDASLITTSKDFVKVKHKLIAYDLKVRLIIERDQEFENLINDKLNIIKLKNYK